MKKILKPLAVLSLSAFIVGACTNQKQETVAEKKETAPIQFKVFGDSTQKPSATTLGLADVVKEENMKKMVWVKATVSEVCQAKGCWMNLSENGQTIRVRFKDYAFFMPKDLAGKTVLVHGAVSVDMVSEEDAKHLAADAGKSAEEIDKIKGEQKEYAMEASTVLIPQEAGNLTPAQH